MGTHMKTTVEISDPLLDEAKAEAQRADITLRELIEVGLRRVLDDRKRAAKKPFVLRDASVPGELLPGIRHDDWRQIRALTYGARLGYQGTTIEEIDRELEEERALERQMKPERDGERDE